MEPPVPSDTLVSSRPLGTDAKKKKKKEEKRKEEGKLDASCLLPLVPHLS